MKFKQSENYCFYEDPYHGWMRVPKKDLVALGIADKISEFSFMDGDYAYLEEDVDFGILLDAMRQMGLDICASHKDYTIAGSPPCPVWDYDRYFYDGTW